MISEFYHDGTPLIGEQLLEVLRRRVSGAAQLTILSKIFNILYGSRTHHATLLRSSY